MPQQTVSFGVTTVQPLRARTRTLAALSSSEHQASGRNPGRIQSGICFLTWAAVTSGKTFRKWTLGQVWQHGLQVTQFAGKYGVQPQGTH